MSEKKAPVETEKPEAGREGTGEVAVRAPGPKIDPRPQTTPSEARKKGAPPEPLTRRKSVPTPTIRSRMIERLEGSPSRVSETDEPLQLSGSGEPISLDTADQRAAVALASILLENFRRVGGIKVSQTVMEGLLDRLLPSLSAEDMMKLEIEAYELLRWIGGVLDPSLEASREPAGSELSGVDYDPDQTHIDLVERAIREGFDLTMLYYTGGRGEITERRITPKRVEAEKYLIAYCHTRATERTFRLSRVARMEPVGGRPVRKAKAPAAAPREAGDKKVQKSLFDSGE